MFLFGLFLGDFSIPFLWRSRCVQYFAAPRGLRQEPFGEKNKISNKSLTMPKNLKGGFLGVFKHPICCKTSKKLKGESLGKKFPEKKSRSAETNWKGDPLVSHVVVCYTRNQEKPFWFSSLDLIVQFGAIKFCRLSKNYFGQFVWIEKEKKKNHYNSRVSLHEAPTKNENAYVSNGEEAEWSKLGIYRIDAGSHHLSKSGRRNHLEWKCKQSIAWCEGKRNKIPG